MQASLSKNFSNSLTQNDLSSVSLVLVSCLKQYLTWLPSVLSPLGRSGVIRAFTYLCAASLLPL